MDWEFVFVNVKDLTEQSLNIKPVTTLTVQLVECMEWLNTIKTENINEKEFQCKFPNVYNMILKVKD